MKLIKKEYLMTDTYFEQIWLDKLDETSMKALQKAVKASYYDYRVEDILKFISDFKMQLWRGQHQDETFILVTQVIQHPNGKELQIWSVGGKGYVKQVNRVYEKLEAFAQAEGCKWISGQIEDARFERVYKRFKPKKVYTTWVTEI